METDTQNIRELPQTCRLCGTHGSFPVIEEHNDRSTSYTLHSCSACDAQWWEPLKNPGAGWYESDVRYAGRNKDPILEMDAKHLGTLAFFKDRRLRVLDVGCGVGNFLAGAKQRGWECYGIDFDRDGIETAKRTFGLNHLEVADITSYATMHPSERFDLVTFFDVFEHIDNHNEFIESIKKILKPGGYIALSTPYRGGWRWFLSNDFPPRHLTRWDLQSLATFMERHGFAPRHQRLLPIPFFFIIVKLRWKYGRAFTFGLVQKVKDASPAPKAREGVRAKPSLKVRVVHTLAKTKDAVLFGIPAFVIWISLLFSKKRNTDLLFVAQLKEEVGI